MESKRDWPEHSEDLDIEGLIKRLEEISPGDHLTQTLVRCAALSIGTQLTRIKAALSARKVSFDVRISAQDVIDTTEQVLKLVEDNQAVGLNQSRVSASVLGGAQFEWNKLGFRSPGEVRIAEALSQEEVMFFPMAAAVAGVKKREPDFLVVSDGKMGILEVQGKTYHPPETAADEHARARWFKKYGIRNIEFYEHARCEQDPVSVVQEFLELLRTS